MADLMPQLPMSEGDFRELIQRVKKAERGEVALSDIAGVTPEELQEFLETKAGLAPDEEAQGSPLAAAVSIAYHC